MKSLHPLAQATSKMVESHRFENVIVVRLVSAAGFIRKSNKTQHMHYNGLI